MLEIDHIAIILAGVLVFAALSRWFESSVLTLPMVFTAFGWLIGQGGVQLVPMDAGHAVIQVVAELTLVLVLFSDASRIALRDLGRGYGVPARLLLIGMPLTIALGTLLAHWASPAASWAVALLVAAILAPTDAALGQAVVTSPAVPQRIRQGINVESGLNDGLALPVVMIAAIAAAGMAGAGPGGGADGLGPYIARLVVLGPLVGLGLGYALARVLDLAIERRKITLAYQGIYFLVAAFLIFVAAELVGGNGLIAAFVGGLTFGNRLRSPTDFIAEFMESEGQLLTIFTFLIFGAVMVPLGIDHASWPTLVVALLFVSVVRIVPIWLALLGAGFGSYEKLFLGWFGPRGLASVLFALLVLERFAIPEAEEILACVVLTVILSIVLHGVSANPMVARFAKRSGKTG